MNRLLRRTLERLVILIATFCGHNCYPVLLHSTKPTPGRSQQNHFSILPLQGGDGLQLHEGTCTMLNRITDRCSE